MWLAVFFRIAFEPIKALCFSQAFSAWVMVFPIDPLILGFKFLIGSREALCAFEFVRKKVNVAVIKIDEDLTLGAGLLCQKTHKY